MYIIALSMLATFDTLCRHQGVRQEAVADGVKGGERDKEGRDERGWVNGGCTLEQERERG